MKYRVFRLKESVISIFLIITLTILSVSFAQLSAVKTDNAVRRLPIYCVKTDEKKIAVTFDAAWSAEDTDHLISILKKHKAKATFFAVGDWVEKNPEAVKKLFDAGHEIANHSDTHAAFSKLTRTAIVKEINDCNKKIEAITNQKVTLVRAPSGDYDNKSIEAAENLSMKMIQWSVDSLDWKKLSTDEMVSRIMTKTENGSILLFHNGVENTPSALDNALSLLSEKGYSFVTVSDLVYKDNYTIDHTGKQILK